MNNQFKNSSSTRPYISIEHVSKVECESNSQIFLRGKFNIWYDQNGLLVRGAEVVKNVVLVVTRTANYQVVTPFKDIIVFESDVVETKDGCSGFFNIEVTDHISFDGEGDYYVLCSLGTCLSNILKITL